MYTWRIKSRPFKFKLVPICSLNLTAQDTRAGTKEIFHRLAYLEILGVCWYS